MNHNVDPDGMDDLEGLAGMVEAEDLAVGTAGWVRRTSGRLTTAERRALLRPLARTHLTTRSGESGSPSVSTRAATPTCLRTASRRPPAR